MITPFVFSPSRCHHLHDGQAAALLHRDGELFTVRTIETSAHGIDQVLWIMNPARITAVSGA